MGDKGGMVMAQDNLGNVFWDLGDLAQARKMHEQSLASARASQNKSGVALILRSLGDVFLAQADFEGAKRDYDESLTARKELGDGSGVLDSRLALAALFIEQGRPAEAESPAREIAAEYHKQKSSLNEAAGLSTLAYSLLEQGKAREAIAAVDRASELVAKSHQTELVMPVLIMAARVHGVAEKTVPSSQKRQSLIEQATSLGTVPFQFEARLALGEVELNGSQKAAALVRLGDLQKDATDKGFLLIAHQAGALTADHRRLATKLSRHAIDQHDAFFFVDFLEANFDDFRVARLHRLPDERGFDRQFAMAAVDQDAEADAPRASQVEKAVHGGAHRAARVEHVVDDHKVAIVHPEGDFGRVNHWLRTHGRQVVAVESDVEYADRDIHARGSADDR
jgi:hypothetical protein